MPGYEGKPNYVRFYLQGMDYVAQARRLDAANAPVQSRVSHRANSDYAKTQYENALQCFDAALRAKKGFYSDAFIAKTEVLLILIKPQAALEVINECLSLDPNNVKALQLKAKIILESSQLPYRTAKELLLHARMQANLQRASTEVLADIDYNLGWVNYLLLDYHQALLHLAQAVKKSPKLDQAYYTRAIIYKSLKNYSAMQADLDRVIDKRPSSNQAYYLRGLAKLYLGKINSSIMDFAKSWRLGCLICSRLQSEVVDIEAAYIPTPMLDQANLNAAQLLQMQLHPQKVWMLAGLLLSTLSLGGIIAFAAQQWVSAGFAYLVCAAAFMSSVYFSSHLKAVINIQQAFDNPDKIPTQNQSSTLKVFLDMQTMKDAVVKANTLTTGEKSTNASAKTKTTEPSVEHSSASISSLFT